MNYQLLAGLVYFVFAVLLIFTGTIIFRENPQRRLNRVTSLLLTFAGLAPLFAAIGIFLGRTQSAVPQAAPFYENLFFLWELFFPQLVLFALVFPRENRILVTNRRIKYLIFIPHVFHILLVTLFADTGKLVGLLNVQAPLDIFRWITQQFVFFVSFIAALLDFLVGLHLQTFSAINLIYVIIALVLLYRGIRNVDNPRLKTQTRIVIGGIACAMGLYILGYILPTLIGLRMVTNVQVALAVSALAVGNGSVIYAIIRYQFLDVRLIVRQSLVYTITSAVIVGFYLLIISQFGNILRSIVGHQTPVLDVAFVVLALIFFQPIMSQVDDLIKRFFIKGKADFRHITEQIARELSSVIDPEQLQVSVVRLLKEEMLIEKVRICLKQGAGGKYLLWSDGPDQAREVILQSDDYLPGALLRRNSPGFVDDYKLSGGRSGLLETVEHLGFQLLVPLTNRGELEGFIAVSQKISGYSYNYEDITTLSVLSNQLVVALANARLYKEALEKQRLEEELTLARQIQLDLLPKTLPSGADFEFATYSQPSRYVGGDFYDFFQTKRDTIGMVVADVSGKGMPAALMVSQIQAILRAEVRNTDTIAGILKNVNYLMATTTSAEKFVTLFYAELDQNSKLLSYSNAGHNYPILVRNDGSHHFLDQGGLLLGVFHEAEFATGRVQLQPGDLVFFYTDGLNEARNPEDQEFGERRILELVRGMRTDSATEVAARIVAEVGRFAQTETLADDLTVVVLKLR